MRRMTLFGLFMGIVVISVPLIAKQGRGRGRGNQSAEVSETDHERAVAGELFSKEQERTIRQWFSTSSNLQGLPPGLAKRETLPPGLQKQLARNGQLPPGLQKKVQPLPPQLEIRLPRLPDGRRRIVIAGNVILLEERTARILDIIQAVF